MSQWLQTASLALASIAFFGSVAIALVHSATRERRLPNISLEYLADADRAFQSGDYKVAAERYRVSAAIAPDDDKAFQRLGLALRLQGDLAGALDAYKRGVRLSPTDPVWYYNAALVFQAMGDLDQAVNHFKVAVQLQPGSAELRTALAESLRKQGRPTEARAQLEQALQIDPAFLPAMSALRMLKETSGSFKP